jgi:hypothetical protein
LACTRSSNWRLLPSSSATRTTNPISLYVLSCFYRSRSSLMLRTSSSSSWFLTATSAKLVYSWRIVSDWQSFPLFSSSYYCWSRLIRSCKVDNSLSSCCFSSFSSCTACPYLLIYSALESP